MLSCDLELILDCPININLLRTLIQGAFQYHYTHFSFEQLNIFWIFVNPDFLIYYKIEEFLMLTDPRLCLFTGDEADIADGDDRPQQKVTNFT